MRIHVRGISAPHRHLSSHVLLPRITCIIVTIITISCQEAAALPEYGSWYASSLGSDGETQEESQKEGGRFLLAKLLIVIKIIIRHHISGDCDVFFAMMIVNLAERGRGSLIAGDSEAVKWLSSAWAPSSFLIIIITCQVER